VIHDEPVPPSRLNTKVPRDLETICLKCLAKELGRRYAGAAALAEDLRRFGEGRPIQARPLSWGGRLWRWGRRKPTTAGLLAALLALFVLTVGGGLELGRREAERRGRAREAVEEALARVPGLRRAGRWPEAEAVLAQGRSRVDEAGSADLRRRLARADEDLRLAAALERIRLTPATEGNRFDFRGMAEAYARAFEHAGLHVRGEPEAVATRIRASELRTQLVTALDHWAYVADATGDRRSMARLLELARRVDPDPRWGDRFREPDLWGDRGRLRRLAAEAQQQLAGQASATGPPTPLVTLLAKKLGQKDGQAEPLLRTAQARHPEEFWLNYELGEALRERKPTEAAGFYRAALATRPTVASVQFEIGMALFRQDQVDEAMVEFRRAIELEPTGAPAHHQLGMCLRARGRLDEAMAEFQRAIDLDPKAAWAHILLGTCWQDLGRLDESAAEFRRAIELDPESAPTHHRLGTCWQAMGGLDEAMAEFRRAIDLEPEGAPAHYMLGMCWEARGRLDEAMAEFRRATELDPGGGMGHESLAQTLLRSGRFAEARAAVGRALDSLAAQEPRRPALQEELKLCERMLALDARLPALLQGEERPVLDDLLELARVCRDYGRPRAAAGLYAAAFAARPELADDLGGGHRYHAACAAARAAAGPVADEARLGGEPDRAGLRRQALDWLRADLALGAKLRRDGKSAGPSLTTWRTVADLADVRDQAPLAKLPAAERDEWRRLWADVDASLAADPLEQGWACSARRDWARAAACYARAIEGGAIGDGHFWFEYAALLLLSGDRPGYVKACAHMIERCGKDGGPRAYHVARACTLAPDAVVDATLPGRLAEEELRASDREFWSLAERGALAYRAGRFQQAVPLFEQSLRADSKLGRMVLNWLWLALANRRLGKAEEARRCLKKAQEWLDHYPDGMPARAEEELGLHPHNWLEAHVLRREAEALIPSTGPRSGPENRD
jgi:serine/threonine-protein kinase